jgi:sulfite exporter TauE/SafE
LHQHALPQSGDLLLLFLASFLASAHCVGMCGPYVALCTARLASTQPGRRKPGVGVRLLFNAGRIATYTAIGALVGAFGQIALAAGSRSNVGGVVALAAGTAAILFGLSLAGVVRDPAAILSRFGLGALIQGGVREAFRAPGVLAPVLLGALQGAFPCALVYGAASRAALAGSAGAGAGVMLVFGLGTVPAIFALSSVSLPLLRGVRGMKWAGVLVASVGVILVLRGLAAMDVVAHSGLW